LWMKKEKVRDRTCLYTRPMQRCGDGSTGTSMPTVKKKKVVKKAKSSGSPRADAKKPSEKITAKERTAAFIQRMKTDQKYRGRVQVRTAAEYRTPYHLRRPTGVMGLDLALNGGFPAGGASQIYGPRSTGKTHLVYRVAGQVQKNYGEDSVVALGMSEQRADIGFARAAGFCVAYPDEDIDWYNQSRIDKGQPPFTAEQLADLQKQIGQVLFLHGTTGGDMLESTIEVLKEFGSACQLIIVDSLGSLLTVEQEQKTVSDKHYGGSSGIITLWQTKVQPLYINDQEDGSCLETTILGINQVRSLIGGPRPGMTRPAAGAKSWEHAQLNSVELKRGDPLWEDKRHTKQAGHIVKWSIRKGKAGTHDGVSGEYDWRHIPERDPVFWGDVLENGSSYAIDVIQDLVTAAVDIGVVQRAGSWRTWEDERWGGLLAKAQGDDNLADVIQDKKLEDKLRLACLEKANLTVRYR